MTHIMIDTETWGTRPGSMLRSLHALTDAKAQATAVMAAVKGRLPVEGWR